jgi:hypothetical protein
MDKSEIQKQAKEILDKFAKSLEKIEKQSKSKDEVPYLDRDEFERIEGSNSKESEASKIASKSSEPTQSKNNFKKAILENAPKSNQDFILTEKGSWK